MSKLNCANQLQHFSIFLVLTDKMGFPGIAIPRISAPMWSANIPGRRPERNVYSWPLLSEACWFSRQPLGVCRQLLADPGQGFRGFQSTVGLIYYFQVQGKAETSWREGLKGENCSTVWQTNSQKGSTDRGKIPSSVIAPGNQFIQRIPIVYSSAISEEYAQILILSME